MKQYRPGGVEKEVVENPQPVEMPLDMAMSDDGQFQELECASEDPDRSFSCAWQKLCCMSFVY